MITNFEKIKLHLKSNLTLRKTNVHLNQHPTQKHTRGKAASGLVVIH